MTAEPSKARVPVDELQQLRRENHHLREQLAAAERELAFLKTHPVFVHGMKGERLVARLAGGVLTKFAAQHDVTLPNEVTIEVKYSKLNTPVIGRDTRRWNWSKPLGWKDKGKDYDLLILVGEKDPRFPDQYLDDTPYVYFMIPRDKVPEVVNSGKAIGAMVQITTNLRNAQSPTSRAIKKYMVTASDIAALAARNVAASDTGS